MSKLETLGLVSRLEFVLIAQHSEYTATKHPSWHDLIDRWRKQWRIDRGRVDEGKWKFHLLPKSAHSSSDNRVWGLGVVGRELDVRAEAEKDAFSRPKLLIRGLQRVVASDIGAVSNIALSFGPERCNQQRLMVESDEWTHKA